MTRTVTMKVRRGTAAVATTNNVTLNEGEWGYETDTDKIKIGDGTTPWTALAYWTGGSAIGDVDGPASSTDNAVTRFDGVTGKLLQDSSVLISDNGSITVSTSGTSYVLAASNTPSPLSIHADVVCSGTDDDVDIETALASYKNVHLMEGTYNIGTILMDESYRYLHGSGNGTILRLQNGTNANAINCTGSRTELSHFKLDGNRTNQTSGHGIYLSYDDFQWNNIHDIEIKRCKENGLMLGSTTMTGASDSEVSDVNITKCDIGLYISKLGGWNVNHIHIRDCTTNGVKFNQTIWAYLSDSRILGANLGSAGVHINASNEVMLADNDVDAWAKEGLVFSGSCYDCTINSNHIFENSNTNTGSYSNLNIAGNLYRTVISNNNFRDVDDEKYSIDIPASSWVEDCTITGNYIDTLNIGDPNRVLTTTIFNNPGYTAREDYVKSVTSTDNAITRYTGTAGQVQNSGATINDNGSITTTGDVNCADVFSSQNLYVASTKRIYFDFGVSNNYSIDKVADGDLRFLSGGRYDFDNGSAVFATFPITPSAAPTANYQAANKKYVDDNEGLANIVEDTTPALGGHLDMDSKYQYDNYTAGDAFSARQIGYIDSIGSVSLATNQSVGSAKGRMIIALGTIAKGASGNFAKWGEVPGFTGLTRGAPYYLSNTLGSITTGSVQAAGSVSRILGYGGDATTKLDLEPSREWIVRG